MTQKTTPQKSFFSIRSQLRQRGLSRRDALSTQDRTLYSHQACSYVIDFLKKSREDLSRIILSGYLPIRSEIAPHPLFHFIRSCGGNLALPAVLDSTTMVFREFSENTVLEEMRFGTIGPNVESRVVIPDIIIVPLSAFDRQCHRLGYGGGYYDRAIETLTKQGYQIRLFGLGFSCQEVESIPHAEHDLIVQGIFTEKGFIEC
ncbi:5-formyltetrahydrofolate cyclo-ligase [Bartonella sp. B30(2025)]